MSSSFYKGEEISTKWTLQSLFLSVHLEHCQPKVLMSCIWVGDKGSNVLYVGWPLSSVSSSKKAKMLRRDVKAKKRKAAVCVAFRKQIKSGLR